MYPDVLVMNQRDIDKVVSALQEGKVDGGYRLDDTYRSEWSRYVVPSPDIFKFYDEVFLKGDSPYILAKTFSVEKKVYLQFSSPEIRIYVKEDRL